MPLVQVSWKERETIDDIFVKYYYKSINKYNKYFHFDFPQWLFGNNISTSLLKFPRVISYLRTILLSFPILVLYSSASSSCSVLLLSIYFLPLTTFLTFYSKDASSFIIILQLNRLFEKLICLIELLH